ncbi:hypothetical protein D9M71_257170 [compost metagenome]
MTRINHSPADCTYALGHTCPIRPRSMSLSEFQSMFLPVLAGLILLTVGFTLRERNVGVFLIWIGMLGILGIMVYKILQKLT